MSGESFVKVSWPALAARAKLTMAEHDEGQRRVAWADLVAMTTADVQAFQDTLQLEGERLGLEVKVYAVRGQAFDGIEVRWRPRVRP